MSSMERRCNMAKITAHYYEAGKTDEWLKLRASLDDKVGGSEIGAIFNQNKYSSFLKELEMWVGAKPRPDLSKKIAVQRGHWDEEFVAKLFEDATGKKVHRCNCIYTNSDYQHCKASIDRKIANEDSGLECKTMNDMALKAAENAEDAEETGKFPKHFRKQCCMYIAVTGMNRWYLAILTGNNELKIYCLTRIKEEVEFYEKMSKQVDAEGNLLLGVARNFTDEELETWKKNYAFLDGCYYVDEAELAECETRAAHFINTVEQVKRYAAMQPAADEQEKAINLANAIVQCVEPEDLGEDDDVQQVVLDAMQMAVPDSLVQVDPDGVEGKTILALLDERKKLAEEIKAYKADELKAIIEEQKAYAIERNARIVQIETELMLKMKTAETFLLPTVRMTFKMTEGRRTASVKTVEAYFKNKGEAVPDGIINVGEAKRVLKIADVKPKKAKKTETKAVVVEAAA